MNQELVTAWCVRCNETQEAGERGCVVCAAVRAKACESAKRRQRKLIEMGMCINGIKHGPPVEGFRRCARCIEVHRRSA